MVALFEQQIDVPSTAGSMTTFICRPNQPAPYPMILFFMDAPGIRDELRDMARRMASAGYCVMLPNLYYRHGVTELGSVPSEPDDPAYAHMVALMKSLDVDMIMDDTAALLTFAEQLDHVTKGPVGCVGYCMSGRFAIGAAARFRDRIAAAASVYGTHLVTTAPDSPHLLAQEAKGEVYFACAEFDPWASMEAVERLRATLSSTKVNVDVEVYFGVEHGFAFPARPAYNKPAAERHWERLFALFARNLEPT